MLTVCNKIDTDFGTILGRLSRRNRLTDIGKKPYIMGVEKVRKIMILMEYGNHTHHNLISSLIEVKQSSYFNPYGEYK